MPARLRHVIEDLLLRWVSGLGNSIWDVLAERPNTELTGALLLRVRVEHLVGHFDVERRGPVGWKRS